MAILTIDFIIFTYCTCYVTSILNIVSKQCSRSGSARFGPDLDQRLRKYTGVYILNLFSDKKYCEYRYLEIHAVFRIRDPVLFYPRYPDPG
jgi:hypothetical protein